MDGYKDTVRNGIDGFAVPTMAAPPGAGHHLATRHALEVDTYDSYIGQASTAVAVDVDATAAAFERLAADPDLRRRMGASGAVRARERFDWQVIVKAYEELWQELAAMRDAGQSAPSPEAMRGFWPARPDPFDLFASFPSLPFSSHYVVSQAAGISEAEVLERLGLRVALVNASPDISSAFLLTVWKLAGGQCTTVRNIIAGHQNASPALTVRALVWLAKLGLLTIALGTSASQ
ncbi:glycosyltransferase [Microvirga soli]|uniref:glycosyltransferase n=1 Tax=Microvirga soli TaxID=1854496 RepID=UPI00191EA6D1|nr:hypothetical protein [Microvirga soli]